MVAGDRETGKRGGPRKRGWREKHDRESLGKIREIRDAQESGRLSRTELCSLEERYEL